MTMITPKSKLPWKLATKKDKVYDTELKNYYIIEDDNHILTENNEEVLGTSEWLRVEQKDADYIIQACNNFPKAIELLKLYEDRFDSAAWDANIGIYSDYAKEINNFLKSLDEVQI